MQQNESIIIRSGPPNKFDQQPWGTICKVIISETDFDIYIQRSKDEEDPKWDFIESFKK